jgi:hypothetical protein
MSGDPYRVIPTDGRGHRVNANPSDYGDSVGRWEGNTLVIETTGFSEDTWFGEDGYFHSDAMRVTERLWREGENLVWQATVEDPKGPHGALDHGSPRDEAVQRTVGGIASLRGRRWSSAAQSRPSPAAINATPSERSAGENLTGISCPSAVRVNKNETHGVKG